jgi:phytoene dehydrogenase-like protein
MDCRVVIIGAGMGGLTAAIRLAQQGLKVRVIEARAESGGLASGFEKEGFVFDAGPYILLDRPGLDWAFRVLGLDFAELVTLRRIEDVYQVRLSPGVTVRFHADRKQTAEGMEQIWPGSGKKYERFVAEMETIHGRLSPLLHISRPGPTDLLRMRSLKSLAFLLRSLGSVLTRTHLPQPVIESIGIWTHIAGQKIDEAPSPMAFVPALIHGVGAFYPVGGVAMIPRRLTKVANKVGVEFQYGTKVRAILCEQGRVRGVETEDGEFVAAEAVVSNHNGVGTYMEMLPETPDQAREKLRRLSLQSPGACAYLAIRGKLNPPYLRFQVPGNRELCRLLVTPGVVAPELENNGWFPARLVAPMRHDVAERLGVNGQRDYLDQLLAESWWRDEVEEFHALATCVPAEWGAQYNLYQDSMNPVMTAGFMRAGRLAHRSPFMRGLYLAGSSTHPGQWVSFCAISGILAANDLLEDVS